MLHLDDVHVWSVSLELRDEWLASLARDLSEEERERAERFVANTHRARFVVGHARLRAILARYLDIVPSAIRFETNPFGKPRIKAAGAALDIRFNFSHSEGLALCAVATRREVGVDVEHIVPFSDLPEIAERYFSPREVAALEALPKDRHCDAFYACWSRKEAYIKARGRGLSIALDSFDVSLIPGDQDALLAYRNEPEALDCGVCDLSPATGFAGALAVEGKRFAISRYTWIDAASYPAAP